MRTSLQLAAPSSITEDEVAHRRKELEPKLYRRHGVLILHRQDADLTGMERLLFDRIAYIRFGKPKPA